MKRTLFIIGMMLTCALSKAQTEVGNFIPGSTLAGVNYFLPQTALRITVVAEKSVVTVLPLSMPVVFALGLHSYFTTSLE